MLSHGGVGGRQLCLHLLVVCHTDCDILAFFNLCCLFGRFFIMATKLKSDPSDGVHLPICMLWVMSYACGIPFPCLILSIRTVLRFLMWFLHSLSCYPNSLMHRCSGKGSCTFLYLSHNLSSSATLSVLLCFLFSSQAYLLCLSFVFLLHLCTMLLSQLSLFYARTLISIFFSSLS